MRSIWIVRMNANKTNEDLLRLNGIFSHPFEQNRPNKSKNIANYLIDFIDTMKRPAMRDRLEIDHEHSTQMY